MGQNSLNQSDWRMFELNLFLEQMMKKPDFCIFMEIYRNSMLIEKYWGGYGQKWVWPLCS